MSTAKLLTFSYVAIYSLRQLFRIWEALGLILGVDLLVFIWLYNEDFERATASSERVESASRYIGKLQRKKSRYKKL